MTTKASEIIAQAKALVEKGWTQGSYAADDVGNYKSPYDDNATCFCTLGALTRVAFTERRDGNAHPALPLYPDNWVSSKDHVWVKAVNYLYEAVRQYWKEHAAKDSVMPKRYVEEEGSLCHSEKCAVIADVNDHYKLSKEDLLKMYDSAIEKAKLAEAEDEHA